MRRFGQSTFRVLTAWALSLSILCSPVLAQAHAWPSQGEPAMSGEMPCHRDVSREPAQPACPHCDENGVSLLCECCEQALSPSLLNPLALQVGQFMPRGELDARVPPSRSDPPPTDFYRPPIDS